ncbi:MAG: bifunctional phosphoribosyl-AMP cyclohydrolase/phosphoribosyl-ATP diphosphatase HisIE [Bacillota bacterium]|nr:bifunctional phosphoribosyl-AMP cyclohydrolase/phosphoribosyl-ATP diphosphatase HisIE [Bacillota bacterium]
MNLKYDENGLIPAIIQDFQTKEILMLGYMNEESLEITKKIKKVTFFSRSRQKIWTKGETSGNFLNLIEIKYDCDKDTLLIQAIPEGPTCHLNEYSCFHNVLYKNKELNEDLSIFQKLELLIAKRKVNLPKNSYTTELFEKGLDKIAQKVGEEAVEVVIASKNNDDLEFIYEVSDLTYHLLVLLAEKNISIKDISKELSRRFN